MTKYRYLIQNLKLQELCFLHNFENIKGKDLISTSIINYNDNSTTIVGIKGLILYGRNDIIIFTLDKLIVFYSIYYDNIVNYIVFDQLEKK